jgi:outer membrane receptor protein involved in Fe transport
LSSAGTAIGQDCAAIAAFTHFPRTTLDLSANYTLPPESYGEWSVQMSYSYKSGNKWSAFDLPSNPFQNVVATKPFGLIDARISLSHIPLSGNVQARLALVGQNLTDKAYNVQGIDFGTYGTISWGKRRTLLVEGTVEF